MKLRITLIVVGLLISVSIYLAWEQYPYRSGLDKMERYFGHVFNVPILIYNISLRDGSFWDDPRFRFKLEKKHFPEFTKSIEAAGYSKWRIQGGSYGSFNQDSYSSDPLFCSSKEKGRTKLMFFYRPSSSIVDAVVFYH